MSFLGVLVYVMISNHVLYLDFMALNGADYDSNVDKYRKINQGISDVDYIQRFCSAAYIAFFPSLLSFGLVFVKKSVDPLSNISKLFYMKLVSIN